MTLAQFREQLITSKQRGLLHLQGQQAWCYSWLNKSLSELSNLDVLWIGEQADQAVETSIKQQLEIKLKQYKRHLGQERDLVVIDCYSGFNPDAFGALTGIVKLGGICILLTPSDTDWIDYPDPELTRLCTEPFQVSEITQCYSRRLVRVLSNNTCVSKISQHHEYFPTLQAREQQDLAEEQSMLVASLVEQFRALSSKSFAAIIQADRGRGKSALMGLLSANLLKLNSAFKILVTAPHSESTETLFKHCFNELTSTEPDVQHRGSEIHYNNGSICFIAPDKLMLELPPADLLLVDEAAAVPIQMLKPLVSHYKNAFFATTVHGYEGTGRGFEYKLKPLLRAHYEVLAERSLSQPIRWYKEDILESATSGLLALNAEISEVSELDLTKVTFQQWSQNELLNHETKLIEIFALLVNAHYRTSPSDLRQILDGPNINVVTLEQNQQTLAAALIAREGLLPDALSESVWQGKRRPRGHLFPQSLLAHSGFRQAGQYSYNRVIRIATHPELQSKGVGSKLLAELEHWTTQENVDFLCTSFGYDNRLVKFWQRAGLKPARFGLKQDASTGEFSILMFKPLKPQVTDFFKSVVTRFSQSWHVEQRFKLRGLDIKDFDAELSLNFEPQDKLDLTVFSEHFRGLNTCLLAMVRFVYTSKEKVHIPDLVLDKCSAKFTDKELIHKYKLTGEKELTSRLRLLWKQILEQHTTVEVNS